MRKIGVILFGLLFVAIGVYLLISGNAKAKRCTEAAVGTVVGIDQEEYTDEDGNFRYTYYPVIEYKAGEKTISKKSSDGSNQSKYKIGDKLDILYNPNKVEEFIIKGDNGSNIIGIVFIALGAIAAIAGVIKRF